MKRTGSRSCMHAHALGVWLVYFQLCETSWRLQTFLCTQLVTPSTVLFGPFQGFLYTVSALLVLQNDSRAPTSWGVHVKKVLNEFQAPPQRHKRERNLRENHHFKRKNNRASQQRAVRSVNVCTELNSSCTAASSLIQLSY